MARDLLAAVRRSDAGVLATALLGAGAGAVSTVAAVVVAGAALPVALVVASGWLARTVVRIVATDAGDAAVTRPLAVVVVLFAAQLLLAPVTITALGRVGRRLDHERTQRLMRALLAPIGISHLEDPGRRDELARARGAGTGVTPGTAVSALAAVATTRLQAGAALVVLLTIRWWIAVPLAVVELASIRFWQRSYQRLTSWALERTPELRRGDWFRDTSMGPAAALELRLFGLGDWFADGFHANWLAGMSSVWAGWRRHRLQVALAVAVPAGLSFVLVLALGREGLDGAIGLAPVVVALQAITIAETLAVASDAARLVTAGAAAARAGDELEASIGSAPASGAPAADLPRSTIRFVDVGFRYPGRDTWALRHLDLELRAGGSTAVVGSNGAGKTTLVRLLARLIEPTEGHIEVDGRPLRDLDAASWRRQLAVVFQDFVRHPLPVADNVGFGRLELRDDERALDAAAQRAGAGELVASLPSGWRTPLSRQMEGGAELSGGEWQRIALARALLAVAGGARVLVLDEPAAALDVRAEADLHDRFLELTAGMTAVVISHRFSTVRPAERIVVLEGGRVIEDGTHDQLVDRRGRYAELFQAQAARFGTAAS